MARPSVHAWSRSNQLQPAVLQSPRVVHQWTSCRQVLPVHATSAWQPAKLRQTEQSVDDEIQLLP